MKGALLATLLHHPTQVDTPLSITNEITGETYHYHSDHQGSITHLTKEDGQSIESFTYDAYGTILAYSQEEETFNPYCYTAREFDRTYQNTLQTNLTKEPHLAVHGLYYYRARYYDPSIGRFISSDPIEFKSKDFNWYRYVNNDPVNRNDPSGLYSLAEFAYDATTNIAGAVDSFTFGATGWISKQLNTFIYGKEAAEQEEKAIKDSFAAEYETYVEIASGVGTLKGGIKILLKKGAKKWKGPANYDHIIDHKSVGPGKKYTQKQKKDILEANKKHNDGILRSDKDGSILNEPKQSQSGVKSDMKQAEVDHIIPKSKGGSNSHSNAQVLSKEQNIKKSDN